LQFDREDRRFFQAQVDRVILAIRQGTFALLGAIVIAAILYLSWRHL
jgi:hypothetical protein